MALAVALASTGAAGCGGGQRPRAAAPCPSAAARALGPAARRPRLLSRDTGLVTCAYAGSAGAVRVRIDTLPQAERRWSDGEVELGQNTAGWAQRPDERPRQVDGVGVGAYWIPAARQLLGTDGPRLITVTVVRPRGAVRAARLARRVGAALMPPVRT